MIRICAFTLLLFFSKMLFSQEMADNLHIEKLAINDQSDFKFIVRQIQVTDERQIRDEGDFIKLDSIFYQDDEYLVRRTCSGEWGGTVWFLNKKTNIKYSHEATCPIAVNKLNGKYYVTSSTGHLYGNSQIIEIEKPESLAVFRKPKPNKVTQLSDGSEVKYFNIGYKESKSRRGSKPILDTVGIEILASFPSKERLYHIASDTQSVFLAEVESGELVRLNSIITDDLKYFTEKRENVIYNYSTTSFITDRKTLVVLFKNKKLKGYIEVRGNEIIYYRYLKKH